MTYGQLAYLAANTQPNPASVKTRTVWPQVLPPAQPNTVTRWRPQVQAQPGQAGSLRYSAGLSLGVGGLMYQVQASTNSPQDLATTIIELGLGAVFVGLLLKLLLPTTTIRNPTTMN